VSVDDRVPWRAWPGDMVRVYPRDDSADHCAGRPPQSPRLFEARVGRARDGQAPWWTGEVRSRKPVMQIVEGAFPGGAKSGARADTI